MSEEYDGGARGDRSRFAEEMKRLLASPDGLRFIAYTKNKNGRRVLGMTMNTQEKIAEVHRIQGASTLLGNMTHLLKDFVDLDREGE